ncbi:hypothetical protein [Pseudomonas extremaustralis]|uniref:hypothetical protein n=1 Tax=Pseudomonas extremaustralis TaxID=359110 RepID=UPI0023DF316A|nr:hypothetical protein [Pseudomonas extremaustralis]MDF3136962.1 hypothetical protein [Pseudomonas extremaustralis]
MKNEGAQGAKLPVGESLHIKQRANKNNCHIKQLVIETQAGKTAFFSEKRGKSAQEVAQCCATSCALGCSPCKSRAAEDLGVVFQLFTVQLFAIWAEWPRSDFCVEKHRCRPALRSACEAIIASASPELPGVVDVHP